MRKEGKISRRSLTQRKEVKNYSEIKTTITEMNKHKEGENKEQISDIIDELMENSELNRRQKNCGTQKET